MTYSGGLAEKTDHELAVIRSLAMAPKQPPTSISFSVVDKKALFDDALRGARKCMVNATPFATFELLPNSFVASFAPLGDDWTETGEEASQELVLAASEWARTAYDLPVETLGQFTGGSGRRYQEYRQGEPMPLAKRLQLAEAIAAVGDLGSIDPFATKAFLADGGDVVSMLVDRDYPGLASKFEAFRTRLAQMPKTINVGVRKWLQAGDLDEMRMTVVSPGFTKALDLIEGLSPQTHATSQRWRLLAVVELGEAFRRYEEESEVTEEWSFLANLNDEEWTTFQDEAAAMLESPHMTDLQWRGWLRRQADAAETNVRHLEPLPPVVLPAVSGGAAVTAAGFFRNRHTPDGER
jgi:hypothetical protein